MFPPSLAHCPEQQSSEPLPEYASRVLRYALTYGIEPLTLDQLEQADTRAALDVAGLPATLDPDQARLDSWLHTLRLRMQARIAEKRAQRLQAQRALDDLYRLAPEDDLTPSGQPGGDAPAQDENARALRLLKAALSLILQPPAGQDGGGGSGARLIPPRPTRPPGGIALQAPPAATPATRSTRF